MVAAFLSGNTGNPSLAYLSTPTFCILTIPKYPQGLAIAGKGLHFTKSIMTVIVELILPEAPSSCSRKSWLYC